jgi:RNA polymerase sigma factor (sigma-70 family)
MTSRPYSFADLAGQHRAEILSYLVRLLGDVEDARDACQDTMLRAQVAFARLRPGSNPRAWLFRIATNAARTTGRRRARRARRAADVAPDGLPSAPGASPEHRDDLRAVARAVDALPPRQRAALMLRRFHDLAYADIAASLGGSEAAARANVYQAVRKLRAAVEDDQ